tara:strand:+ start:6541 stop:7836 length:1296 start_codon:yes stop_codon:yes gene_type:complete
MTNFKNKYLEYKLKYINLQNKLKNKIINNNIYGGHTVTLEHEHPPDKSPSELQRSVIQYKDNTNQKFDYLCLCNKVKNKDTNKEKINCDCYGSPHIINMKFGIKDIIATDQRSKDFYQTQYNTRALLHSIFYLAKMTYKNEIFKDKGCQEYKIFYTLNKQNEEFDKNIYQGPYYIHQVFDNQIAVNQHKNTSYYKEFQGYRKSLNEHIAYFSKTVKVQPYECDNAITCIKNTFIHDFKNKSVLTIKQIPDKHYTKWLLEPKFTPRALIAPTKDNKFFGIDLSFIDDHIMTDEYKTTHQPEHNTEIKSIQENYQDDLTNDDNDINSNTNNEDNQFIFNRKMKYSDFINELSDQFQIDKKNKEDILEKLSFIQEKIIIQQTTDDKGNPLFHLMNFDEEGRQVNLGSIKYNKNNQLLQFKQPQPNQNASAQTSI